MKARDLNVNQFSMVQAMEKKFFVVQSWTKSESGFAKPRVVTKWVSAGLLNSYNNYLVCNEIRTQAVG